MHNEPPKPKGSITEKLYSHPVHLYMIQYGNCSNHAMITYSQNSLNPYLSVDSPGYGFSEVMGLRG